MITIPIGPNEAGSRLDKIARKSLPLRPLADIYRLIRTGGIRVNGKKAAQNYRCAQGDTLEMKLDESELRRTGADQELSLDITRTNYFKNNLKIIYEDDWLIACNKPPHLVVHPGSGHTGHTTLIDLIKAYLQLHSKPGQEIDPALVHRIDRDTSGVVLTAKDKPTLRAVHELFRSHDLVKRYIAVCHGRPPRLSDVIDVPLSRTLDRNDGTKVVADDSGDEAVTEYSVVWSGDRLSKLDIIIHTGRTHQIRAHMNHINCPLVGDVRYGDPVLDRAIFASSNIKKRLYLHAARLELMHPVLKKILALAAPEPQEFREIVE